jgi:hypothetical protein
MPYSQRENYTRSINREMKRTIFVKCKMRAIKSAIPTIGTYVLDVVGEIEGIVEGGINEGDVVLAGTLVPEADQHFNGLTSRED